MSKMEARQDEILKFTDILPGLLSVSMRLPSIIKTMKATLELQGED